MKKNRNSKHRMLLREKKCKLKNKMKKLTCLSAVAVMLASMINPQALVYATSTKNTNQIIKNKVEYNDDYSKASIEFDLDSLDKEKYELISIISDKENTVIYDKDKITEENKSKPVSYETVENGSYSFSIKYAEKQKEVQVGEGNIKETEVIDIDDDTRKVTEEKNQDIVNRLVEKQEEIYKNTTVKEEKVIVNVTEIKMKDILNEIENEVVNLPIEYESQNIANNEELMTVSDDLNLSGNFYVASWKGNVSADKPSISLSDAVEKTIEGNKLRLTTPEKFEKVKDNYYYQSTSLTYKNIIDMNRSFRIEGDVFIDDYMDALAGANGGFAISFHKERGYKYGGGYSGNLGIYNTRQKNGLNSPALIIETDGYDNFGADQGPLGDTDTKQQGAHLAIQTYKNKNTNPVVLKKSIIGYNKKLTGTLNFKLEMRPNPDGNTVNVKYNVGKYNIEQNVNLKNIFGNDLTGITFTISGAAGTGTGGLPDGTKVNGYCSPIQYNFTFKGIKYMDATPNITTSAKVESDKEHAISGEKVTITHELWNGKQSSADLNDKLNLKDMRIDGAGNNLEISNIRSGIDLNNLTLASEGTKFDSNTPLDVIYPANQEKYYVQYDVTIPELNNYGNINKLNCEVLLGQEGMSQINSSKVVDIKNKPALYSKKGSSQITDSQIIKVSSPSEVTKNLLWSELYSKVALASSSEYKINVEDSGTNDMKFEWEYQVNGNKVETFPDEIEKGNIYSLKLKVTDKSDTRLSNEFNRTIIIEEDMVQADEYYIHAEDSKPISETKLATLTQDEFKEYVKTESKAKAFKVNSQTGAVESKEVEVKLDGWLDNQGEPYHIPGTETIELYVTEKTTVEKVINQEVTENTWSYDTKDRTEENGASGFIVIPKNVDLESGSGDKKNKLIGKADIYFANYTAKDVQYNVSVDKTFKLVKDGDPSSKFTVTSVGRNAGASNKMRVGEINYRYDSNHPQTVSFEAPREEVDKSKGRWKGNVRFYFERVTY